MIYMAGGNAYSVIHEHKNGWNPEMFRERYSEVLERFDYIVGDWGYNQLRLRGFYKDGHPRAAKDSAISSLADYINEYCNFGCAYFVVAKLDSKTLSPEELEQGQKEAEATVAAAIGEAGEQSAETAAALSNGPLMRWPLKERPGSPVRVPNVTVSAVARAAAESAERRNANKGDGGSSQQRSGSNGRNDGGGSYNRSGKPSHGGGERRQGSNYGQGGQERGGGQDRSHGQGRNQNQRGPRPQQHGEGGNRASEGRQQGDSNAHPNAEAARNGSRWPGKNRRRKSFGGKPGPRPEGGQRSEQGGNPRVGE